MLSEHAFRDAVLWVSPALGEEATSLRALTPPGPPQRPRCLRWSSANGVQEGPDLTPGDAPADLFWPRAEAEGTRSSAPSRGGAAWPIGGVKGSHLGCCSLQICPHRAQITWLFPLLQSSPAPFQDPFASPTRQNFPPEAEAESWHFSPKKEPGKGSRSRVLEETTAVSRPPRVTGCVRAARAAEEAGAEVIFHSLGLRAGNARLAGPAEKMQKTCGLSKYLPEQMVLCRGVKFRSKSKQALANGEG